MSHSAQPKFTRRKKLVKKGLQLRLIGIVSGVALLTFFLHSLLMAQYLTNAAAEMPSGGRHLLEQMPGMLMRSLAFSVAVLLPVITIAGVLATFRIAGPIFRIESHLRKLARGESVPPCRLRKGDELQGMCELVDQVADRLGALEGNESKQPRRAA